MTALRKWLAPTIIALLTALFLLLWESPPGALLPGGLFRDSAQRSAQDEYPSNILIRGQQRQFDESGRLDTIVQAERADYYRAASGTAVSHDHTRFEQPRVTLLQPAGPPWQASAEHGSAAADGSLVELLDRVVLQRDLADGTSTRLETSQLLLKPQQKFAETDKPVTIRSTNAITRATGMRAHLQEERIQLLSEVRGTYEPAR